MYYNFRNHRNPKMEKNKRKMNKIKILIKQNTKNN